MRAFISIARKRVPRRKKAVSTIVGGVIVFAIMAVVFVSYFGFEMSSSARIQQAAVQRYQLDASSTREIFAVTAYPDSNNNIVANITSAASSSAILISDMIIGNGATNLVISTLTNLNRPVRPGSFQIIDTGVPYPGGQIWVKVQTTLGTTNVALYPSPINPNNGGGGATSALNAGAIGDIYLVFSTFSWYSVVNCGSSSGYCLQTPGQNAYVIPVASAQQIAFGVQMVNLNPLHLTITLDSFTQLMQFWPQGSSYRVTPWLVLSNQSTNIASTYTPIVLPFNVTKTVVFGDGCQKANCDPSSPASPFQPQVLSGSNKATVGIASTFIFVHGWKNIPTSQTANYGQNLPFETTNFLSGATLNINPTLGPPGTSITLTGSGYSASTVYSDCLGTNAGLISSCLPGSTSSFTTDSNGNIPPGTTMTVPAGTPTGTYYVLVYQGTVVKYAGFTVANSITFNAPAIGSSSDIAGTTNVLTVTTGGSGATCTGGTSTSVNKSQLPYTVLSLPVGTDVCYSFPSPVAATSPTERYVWSSTSSTGISPSQTTQTGSFSAPASGTVTAIYQQQFQVTFAVSPVGAGTTTPSGTSVWENAGSLSISATVNAGFRFLSWSSSTGSITFASSTSASTTATISGSGTITANFMSRVTQPLSMTVNEAGAPSGTFTISGCSPIPTTITGDGSNQTVAMDASCAFALTITNSGGSRYGFISGTTFSATSASQNSCASGTCALISLNYDLQEKLTVNGGFGVTFSKASETIDGWYNYGGTLTVSTNAVGPRASGTGQRISSWNLDGGANIALATSGVFTTPTITMTAPHTVNFNPLAQYFLTVIGGNPLVSYTPGPSIPGDTGWYDAGTSVTVSSNWIWNVVSGHSRTAISNWQLDGTNQNPARHGSGNLTTTSIVMNAPHTVTFVSLTQYFLTVNGGSSITYSTPSQTGDNWYDSGTSTTVSSSGVFGRSGGVGQRVSSWNIDGGANTNVAALTATTSSVTMSTFHTVNFNSVAQYQVTLDSGATSALNSITSPTIAGDNYWYDSGTHVTLVLNGVYGRSGGTGGRLTGYSINGGANSPVSTAGTVTVLNALTIASPQSITTTGITQFFLTVTGGNSITYSVPPSIAGDTGWYDSGTSLTVSSNWVWNVVAGQSRTAITNWQLDGTNQNPTRANSGTLTTSSITMNSAHTVTFVSLTQYFLTVTGGNGIAYGTASPTADNWYDTGTSTTVSSNWVWNVVAGQSRTAINNWQLDGTNQNPARRGSGTLTTSSITMSTFHTVNFASLTQYFLTVNGGNGITYGTASPTADAWYDAGTSTTVSSNGIYNRAGGTGQRVSSWNIGGSNTNVVTAGTVTTSSVTMSTFRTVNFNSVTQYQVTIGTNGHGSVLISPLSTISGDTGWYDSGSVVTITATNQGSHIFQNWTHTGSIAIANPNSASTTATISGTGTITGNFT